MTKPGRDIIPGLKRSTKKRIRCALCGTRSPRASATERGFTPLLQERSDYLICPDCRTKRRTGPGLDALGRVSRIQIEANRRPMGWKDKHSDFTKHMR